jgi:hypothetical protein
MVRLLLVSTFVLGASLAIGSSVGARAGDPPEKVEGLLPLKAVQSAFLKGLVGTWETEMTEGDFGRHKGRSTWRLLLGDSALVEDYTGSMTGADGKTVPWTAHVVVREGEDGKSLEGWMFDNLSLPPLHFLGTHNDAGFDVSAETPDGKMRVTCEKKAAERVFRIWMGENPVMTEVYRPIPK